MATIKLDQVAGYALIGAPVQSPVKQYLVAAKDSLLAAINAASGTSLTVAHLEFGIPQAAPASEELNTELTLTPGPGSGYSGSATLRFNRAPIADIVVNRDLDLFKYNGSAVRVREMLHVFNTVFGTALDSTDIIDEDIPQDGPTIFKAAPESLFFIPGTEVDVGMLAPSARDWEIAGLEWPDMSPSYTYGLDFSSISATLEALAASGSTTTTVADTLCNTANSLRGDTFFVASYASYRTDGLPGGLRSTTFVKVTLPNTTYATNNSGKFNRALVVFPQANAWFKDPMVFHYNA